MTYQNKDVWGDLDKTSAGMKLKKMTVIFILTFMISHISWKILHKLMNKLHVGHQQSKCTFEIEKNIP